MLLCIWNGVEVSEIARKCVWKCRPGVREGVSARFYGCQTVVLCAEHGVGMALLRVFTGAEWCFDASGRGLEGGFAGAHVLFKA